MGESKDGAVVSQVTRLDEAIAQEQKKRGCTRGRGRGQINYAMAGLGVGCSVSTNIDYPFSLYFPIPSALCETRARVECAVTPPLLGTSRPHRSMVQPPTAISRTSVYCINP